MTNVAGTSITAEKGRAFLLQADTTGVSPTVYQTVTGLRATDLSINGNPVDITSKSSNGWRELLPDGGIEQVEITASGVYDGANNVAQPFLEKAALNRSFINAQVVFGNGVTFVGTWVVSPYKTGGTHNEAQTFDLTLMSHGPVIRAGN
jgi:predicted secreted protein